MVRYFAARRPAIASIPMLAAAALVVAGLTAPLSASATPMPRSGGASPEVVHNFLKAAHGLMMQKSHMSGSDVSRPHVSPLCTFNGGTSLVTGVTPGSAIAVSCTGFLPTETVVLGEASGLTLVVDSDHAADEIDPNAIKLVTTDGTGAFATSFAVPSTYGAPDPAATCPPTQIQVNSGLTYCELVVVDSSINGFIDGLSYTGQPTPQNAGYQEVASDGGLFSFGTPFQGSEGGKPLTKPIVGIAFDPDTGGYWEVASDGGIFAFNAPFDGSMGGTPLVKPIVGMAFDPNSGGYWEVASDGGIFSFGGAPFDGSMGGKPLTKPIVGITADPTTGGYWEVASDGGIFSFGGAPFYGSMGGKPLTKPIVGMALDSNTGGYWEVASDGGIFSFNAPFQGSEGGKPLTKPIVSMADDSLTGGYWEVASDGGLFSFNAPFQGSEGGKRLDKPMVGMAPALIE
jgi:hypothetical protein